MSQLYNEQEQVLTKKRILFVCLGNIVRSPLAENVFRDMVAQEGLQDVYESSSAGIEPWHVGEPPDPRMVRVASRRGLVYSGTAKQVNRIDLPNYDLILAMDHNNLSSLLRLADGQPFAKNIRLLRDYDPQSERGMAVPDPYYGGLDGFETVYDIIKRSCRGLLDALEREDSRERSR